MSCPTPTNSLHTTLSFLPTYYRHSASLTLLSLTDLTLEDLPYFRQSLALLITLSSLSYSTLEDLHYFRLSLALLVPYLRLFDLAREDLPYFRQSIALLSHIVKFIQLSSWKAYLILGSPSHYESHSSHAHNPLSQLTSIKEMGSTVIE